MNARCIAITLSILVAAASAALALNPDDELWIPAAARGGGNDTSMWITDLYVMNLGDETVTVAIEWLERAADNTDPVGEEYDIDGGETLVLDDVIFEVFGMETGYGGFHIEVVEEAPVKAAAAWRGQLIAFARVYNVGDSGDTFGQGAEGLRSDTGISAGNSSTHVIGVGHDADFRANWYGVNITDDEAGEPAEAEVRVELLDLDGTVLASGDYVMPPWAPMLMSLADLGGGTVSDATVRFTMLEGEGIFGVSKIDRDSNDPTTLEAHWECGSCRTIAGETAVIAASKLYIEFNATDEDIGVHGAFDDDGYSQLCVYDPEGRQILSLNPKNQLEDLTMAGIFFESREPPIDEFSFEDLKREFPEGKYTVVGVTYEGQGLTGFATFTHDVPEEPEITEPELVEDEEDAEDAEVPIEGLEVRWQPVTMTIDEEPVTITGYEVIITMVEHDDPNGYSRPTYDVHVAADRTSLSVPAEFLEADTVYELEVLALEVSGNQTISVGFFKTE